MQVIGQHDERVDREGKALPCAADHLTQVNDMVDEQGSAPLQQIDREEPASTRNESTTIVWHEAQDSAGATGFVVGAADYAIANPPYGLSAACPTGKSRRFLIFLSSPLAKNIPLRRTPKSNL